MKSSLRDKLIAANQTGDPRATDKIKAAQNERDEVIAERDELQARIQHMLEHGEEGGNGPELVPLDDLKHPDWNCWELSQTNVDRLVDDILERGLIEPLIIDVSNIVIAGNHRLKALLHIANARPSWFDEHFSRGVPVHRKNFSYQQAPFEGGLLQMAANFNRRKPPTPTELRPVLLQLISKMDTTKYHFGRGNPGKKQPVVPIFMKAFGVSDRTISRALANDDDTANELEAVMPSSAHKKPTLLISCKRIMKDSHTLIEKISELPSSLQNDEMKAWIAQTHKIQGVLKRIIDDERNRRS